MRISHDHAQPIVDRLSQVMACPISITDERGIIIASSESSRLGTWHEAALEAIASHHEIHVSKEKASDYIHTLEGVTLPLVLHDIYVGALCLGGKPDELKDYASVISIAVLSLLETAEITNQAHTKQRLSDTWVKSLIGSSDEDDEETRMQASILGIDCQKLAAILVIRFQPSAHTEAKAIESAVLDVARAGSGLQFSSYVGQGQFVCGITVAEFEGEIELRETCEALARRLANMRILFHIGVGRPNKNIAGYRQSYYDAFHSARVAERLGDFKRILYYNEQHIFRLLEGVPDYLREVFIESQTEGLKWDPVLLETLQTYFAMDCHVNETARSLYIHRNTLLFRLNKISDIYKLDPRTFHDAVVLQVLLYLLQLTQDDKKEG